MAGIAVVLIGVFILMLLAIVFHAAQEYFWAVVFFVAGGLLGSFALILLFSQPGASP